MDSLHHALVLYEEIQIFCMVLLLYVYIKARKINIKNLNNEYFGHVIMYSISLILTDLIWKIIEKDFMKTNIFMCYTINTMYFMLLQAIYYYIFIDTVSQVLELKDLKEFEVVSKVPLYIIFCADIANVFYGKSMFFYIDIDKKEYIRGPLYPFEYLAGIYLIGIIVILVYKYMKDKTDRLKITKGGHTGLLFYPMILVISGLIGLKLPDTPVLTIGLCIMVLSYFIISLENYITIDPLTGFSTKSKLYMELERVIRENAHPGLDTYLILVTIEDFKKINEEFGYIEGDNAIKRVADSLLYIYGPESGRHGIITRYTGCEFAILLETSDQSDVELSCSLLQNVVDVYTVKKGAKFRLKVLYGYSKYVQAYDIDTFIDMADMNLLARERRKKNKKED